LKSESQRSTQKIKEKTCLVEDMENSELTYEAHKALKKRTKEAELRGI
jgi:hypothetical protein